MFIIQSINLLYRKHANRQINSDGRTREIIVSPHCICELCGKVFETTGETIKHRYKVHKDTINFYCPYCGSQFSLKVNIYLMYQSSFEAMWNSNIAAVSARAIAAVRAPMVIDHSDKLFSGALTLGTKSNSYNEENYLINIVKILFSPQYQCTTEKSLSKETITIGGKNLRILHCLKVTTMTTYYWNLGKKSMWFRIPILLTPWLLKVLSSGKYVVCAEAKMEEKTVKAFTPLDCNDPIRCFFC